MSSPSMRSQGASAQESSPSRENQSGLHLTCLATFPNLRALAWDREVLYASRGYQVLRAKVSADPFQWERVASYSPVAWRGLTSCHRLTSRLFRDGFHALATLSTGHLIAAVPGAIVTLAPGEREFRATHKIIRGTRPLHIAVTPDDRIFWGEYFDNAERDEVHIFASTDRGATWDVAYTFPKSAIRHVHNIVFDQWADCLWVLTGDNGPECRILRADLNFSAVNVVLAGNQQARAVALVPAPEGVYFSSDTPFETNHVYFLDRSGKLSQRASLSSSSIYACRVGEAIFISTMVEPSAANPGQEVHVYGTVDGREWPVLLEWKKDRWPMGLFQYGNVFFPDGENASGLLAATAVSVERADGKTTLWRVPWASRSR